MKTCILDGRVIEDRKMLHQVLAQGLDFPEWYGRNLDALADCLGDLKEEAEIQIVHEAELRANLGTYMKSLQRVFRDAVKENPHLHIQVSEEA